MECNRLKLEAERNRALSIQLEQAIAMSRSHNQTVGYVATVMFPPLWLATRTDDEAKQSLNDLQAKQDRIGRLWAAKRC